LSALPEIGHSQIQNTRLTKNPAHWHGRGSSRKSVSGARREAAQGGDTRFVRNRCWGSATYPASRPAALQGLLMTVLICELTPARRDPGRGTNRGSLTSLGYAAAERAKRKLKRERPATSNRRPERIWRSTKHFRVCFSRARLRPLICLLRF
jgi:hypothetical protein